MNRPQIIMGFALVVSACRSTVAGIPSDRADAGRSREVTLSPAAIANGEIKTEVLAPGSFAPHLRITGTLSSDPQHLAHVGARVTGRVAAINVKLGDKVARGQSLVEIDTAELHVVTLEYFTSQARAFAANDALARQRKLVEERVGAEQDLKRSEAEASAANAAVKEAEEHLHFLGLSDAEIQKLRTQSTHGEARSVVHSPIAGRVANLAVSMGQVLLGNEDVATVADIDTVWVSLRIYERDLAGVSVGSPIEVRVPSYPDKVFTGTITFVSDLVDNPTRTLEARAPLANSDGLLRPGMAAVASVAPRDAPVGLWVPAQAVQRLGADRVVFVRTGDRRFEARTVVIGTERAGVVPLISGLAQGSDVVTQGAFMLRGTFEHAEPGD